MGLIGGELGYQLLRRIAPGGAGMGNIDGSAYRKQSKIAVLLGRDVLNSLRGKRVADFGCGDGEETLSLIQYGPKEVIGIEVQDQLLEKAQRRAAEPEFRRIVRFARSLDEQVQVVLSIDSFEHFAEPGEILTTVSRLLQPGGAFHISFGPPWLHPLGGHLFSVFPWAHLIFTESALIRWRSDFKTDGATRFAEVAGGLNQMTISRFLDYIERSPLRLEHLELVPIRRLRFAHSHLSREFFTSVVRATLVHRH